MITFTMTTCKRLDCFLYTMDSIDKKLTDFHLVGRKIIIDDCSTDNDRGQMEQRCPGFEFIWRNDPGHDKSLRDLIPRIDSEYWLHWEDDRPMGNTESAISMALEVLEYCPFLSSIKFDNFRGGRQWVPGKEAMYCDVTKSICRTPSGINYDIPLFDSNLLAPSFSLSPSLHRFARIKSVFDKHGYPETQRGRNHEYEFALSLYKAGILAAHLDHSVTYHLGTTSSYRLNNTPR